MPRPAKMNRGLYADPLAEAPTEPGRFVVVATAAPPMRDLMLTAIRRRLASRQDIQFPMIAAELRRDRLVRDGVLALSRAQFRAFEGDGAFAMVWSDHGVRMGLPREAVFALVAGATLVVPGPATLAIDARRWTDRVSIVGIAPDVDRVRQPLSPKACLARLVAPRMRRHIEGLSLAAGGEFAVSVGPDIGRSIAELTAAIVAGGD